MKTSTISRPRPIARAVQLSGLAVALCVTGACASSAASGAAQVPQPPREGAAPAESTASLAAQLRAAIGDASCTENAQCRTLAWGSKACGGPQAYVAWSTTRSDGRTLEELATRHAAAQARDNEASGRMSDCRLLTDPGAQCVANRCVLNTHAATK